MFCWVLALDAKMVSLVYIFWSVKSLTNLCFFDITLFREVVLFFSDDPQLELSKRKVIDLIPVNGVVNS
jgi:hypothetical protein